jgi:hypothetical protein
MKFEKEVQGGHYPDGVIEYDIPNAINPVTKNYFDDDNFYPFDGEGSKTIVVRDVVGGDKGIHVSKNSNPYAKFDELPSWNEDTSEIFGLGRTREERREDREDRRARRAERRAGRRGRRDERRGMRRDRQQSRSAARLNRSGAKLGYAEAQKVIAGNIGQGDDAMLRALSADTGSPEKEGMSTGAKIAIAVGALAVVGGIIYFVMKKKK